MRRVLFMVDARPNGTVHEVKLEKPFFELARLGILKANIRINDRDYKLGDILHFMEFDKEKNELTGERHESRPIAGIIYADDVEWLAKGHVFLQW